jgi:Phosphotransferase enzyme family
MTDIHLPPHEQVRVILIQHGSDNISVSGSRGAFALPTLSIPAYSRHAEEITGALLRFHDAETYCLFTLPSDSAAQPARHYSFSCLSRKSEFCSPEFHWIDRVSIASEDLADKRDFAALQAGFELIDRCRREPRAGYFGRPGWLEEIIEWTRLQLARQRLHLTGTFSQLNASATASLVRFDTDVSGVWFKATGELNHYELPITEYVAEHFPDFAPPLVGTHANSNGWLTIEVPGSRVNGDSDDGAWIAVAGALAEFQQKTMPHGLHLLEAGCIDVRPHALAEFVGPFLEVMGELMDQQTKASPAPLTRQELDSLRNVLFGALSAADALDLPSALVNLDFNLGNMIVGSGRVTFLDWASGAVGNPFFTFEYFLEQLRTARPADHRLRTEVAKAYLRRWRSLLDESVLAEAVAVTPLLAAFSYATSAGAWCDPSRRRDPAAAGHLRSITRRMKREGEVWASKRAKARDLDPQPR